MKINAQKFFDEINALRQYTKSSNRQFEVVVMDILANGNAKEHSTVQDK